MTDYGLKKGGIYYYISAEGGQLKIEIDKAYKQTTNINLYSKCPSDECNAWHLGKNMPDRRWDVRVLSCSDNKCGCILGYILCKDGREFPMFMEEETAKTLAIATEELNKTLVKN